MKSLKKSVLAMMLALAAGTASADIAIGVTVSATGPGAALGAPQRTTAELFPDSLAGHKIQWILLDDATDPTQASRNVSKFLTQDKVDAVIGSSTTANTAAIVDAVVEARTPLMALAPIDLPAEKSRWVFRMPQNNRVMGEALVEHMKANGVKRLGIIGFADVYGDLWLQAIEPLLKEAGIELVASERFNRTDTSVMGQTIKIITSRPDAVLVVGGGTPAALPHVTLNERGYRGQIYQTHGAPSDAFLKVGGRNVEQGLFVAGPLLVWDQLPDGAATKDTIRQYVERYEGRFGKGTVSSFGGHMWDAWALLEDAIPRALKAAEPGTEAFRVALRDALETAREVVGVHGVYTMSPTDHFGHDRRSRVLIQVRDGKFELLSTASH